MRLHKHTQNRDSRRQISRLLHVGLYPPGDRDAIADLDLQTVVSRKPQREFSARFHLGKRWSETPLDAHLTVAGTGLYWSVNFPGLRKIAHALTKGEGRDLSLSTHGGKLWWRLWTGEDHCNGHNHWRATRKGKRHMPWLCRDGNIPTDPLELIYGPMQYHFEDIDTADGLVVMPEGIYPVNLKLRRVTRGYRNGKRRRYQYMDVNWDCKGGIPWMYDHSGGWKGTGVYGSSVRVPDDVEGKDWASIAAVKIAAAATESRVRTGWTPEHESAVA
jgi:hypothetical protein